MTYWYVYQLSKKKMLTSIQCRQLITSWMLKCHCVKFISVINFDAMCRINHMLVKTQASVCESVWFWSRNSEISCSVSFRQKLKLTTFSESRIILYLWSYLGQLNVKSCGWLQQAKNLEKTSWFIDTEKCWILGKSAEEILFHLEANIASKILLKKIDKHTI